MLVNLSKNSWHSKYYNFVKGYYPSFKSLCPYFWTIVSLIVFSPLILFWKGLRFIGDKLCDVYLKHIKRNQNKPLKKTESSKSKSWIKINQKKVDNIIEWIVKTIVITFSLFGLFIILLAIYDLFNKKGLMVGFAIIFSIIGVIASIIGITWGLLSFGDSDTWKMIKGMIYSVKNKVCPMIKWDNND